MYPTDSGVDFASTQADSAARRRQRRLEQWSLAASPSYLVDGVAIITRWAGRLDWPSALCGGGSRCCVDRHFVRASCAGLASRLLGGYADQEMCSTVYAVHGTVLCVLYDVSMLECEATRSSVGTA